MRALAVGCAAAALGLAACGDDSGDGRPFAIKLPFVVTASDTASDTDPRSFWGSVDCDLDSDPPWRSGEALVERGGDHAATASGTPQGDEAFRRLTAFDGDDFYGERCELGLNDNDGPVAFYREGERQITFASFRLPDSYPLDAQRWQGVLQMKQAQPADNGDGTPALSLSAFDGRWSLWHSDAGYTDEDFEIWSTPAEKGRWTRVAIDAVYSQDPELGQVTVHIDLDGDGDFSGDGETSPTFHLSTLKREDGVDGSDGLDSGDSIPSHLRVGIYHHEEIGCPPPAGCSVDVDNVQVVRAPSATVPLPGAG